MKLRMGNLCLMQITVTSINNLADRGNRTFKINYLNLQIFYELTHDLRYFLICKITTKLKINYLNLQYLNSQKIEYFQQTSSTGHRTHKHTNQQTDIYLTFRDKLSLLRSSDRFSAMVGEISTQGNCYQQTLILLHSHLVVVCCFSKANPLSAFSQAPAKIAKLPYTRGLRNTFCVVIATKTPS